MRSKISEICVLSAGILWGCMGILQRTMSGAGFESMEMVFVRATITTICMFAGMFIFNRNSLKIKLKDLWCFIGTGMLSVVFFNFCYFSCMKYTTLSVAAILLYTAPSFVMIMSLFLFKESFTGKKLTALILSFVGCVCVSGGMGGGEFGIKGLLFGLGAGFGYALYSIFGRYAINRGYGSMTITSYTFLFAMLGCMIFINPAQVVVKIAEQSFFYIIFEIVLIIAVSVCAYLLYTKGLSGLENGKSSILASVEPVVATIISILLFKESMTIMMFVGIALVLTSIIIVDTK